MMDQTLLLVVGISEGRNFPNRHGYQLIVETRFQGEILQCDPVDHVNQPIINTELAWSLSKKSLHQHRLQRTPIKLQMYAVSSHHGNTKQGDSIGYIMLDLRMATPKGHAQWYGLQNCQYSQQRPQIYVTMTTEQDHISSNQEISGKDISLLPGATNAVMTLQLDEEQGYYTLGEITMDTPVSILSVTITSARRLSQLGGSYHGDEIADKQSPYYFYYSLLGNDITNGAFYSLVSPNFRPERASIRIKTDQANLNTFLSSLADIKVHLYAGKTLLAVARIPLSSLATVTTITDEYPLLAEGANVSMDTCPLVAVIVSIITEVLPNDDSKPLPMATTLSSDDDDESSKSSHSNSSHSNSIKSVRRSLSEQFNMVTMETANQPSSKCSSPASPLSINEAIDHQTPPPISVDNQTPISTTQNNHGQAPNPTDKVSSVQTPSITTSNEAHHYCVAIDVRSLRLLVDHMSNAQLNGRYSYPFFGTSQSVILPAIMPSPYVECLFDQSYCAFDFATPREVLITQMNSVPLEIQLLENNSSVVAMATIMMSVLLTQPVQVISGGVHRQYHDSKVAVVTSHDHKLIGELHVIISLEDHGPVQLPCDPAMRSCGPAMKSCDPAMKSCDPAMRTCDPAVKSCDPAVKCDPAYNPEGKSSDPAPKPVSQGLRNDPEYHVAMEMEVWRAQQEEIFMKQLQQKEADHLRLLAEEWKQREKQRDHMIQTKVTAYQKLQEQLQQSLDHVIQQRQQLEAWQQELHKLEGSLQEERRNLTSRLEDVSNKLEQEYEHKLKMEQLQSRDLQTQVAKLTNQLAESDRILANRTAELEAHLQTAAMATGGDTKLQAQMNTLLLEKSQLEQKLLSANKSRQHYKEQWSHALRELAHMRQQEASASRQRLRQQEQELDHMRQQLLSHSSHQVLTDEIEKLRNETERLQQQINKRKDQSSPGQLVTKTTDADITRWIEERDILLQTGLYSSDDPTISRLDQQIRNAMAAKKQPVTS